MNKKKITLILLLALAIIVAVLAVVHLTTREEAKEGALAVHIGDRTEYVDLSLLDVTDVKGEIVNGKGEKIAIEAEGFTLPDVLAAAKVDPSSVNAVTATADDGFSAEVSGDELREAGKAYLYLDDDGAATLVVFGDENAKRNVRNVISLDVDA